MDNEQILTTGTRVWVWEPVLFGEKSVSGKIEGWAVKFDDRLNLLDRSEYVEYLVDFNGQKEWVYDFQITGHLSLVQ